MHVRLLHDGWMHAVPDAELKFHMSQGAMGPAPAVVGARAAVAAHQRAALAAVGAPVVMLQGKQIQICWCGRLLNIYFGL